MPEHSTELSVPARYAELPRLMSYAAETASALGMPVTEIPRIQLILEELFSNTLTHGYQRECNQPVEIGFCTSDEGCTLIYRDQAAPFDLSKMAAREPDDDQIGGLGINLILGMARSIRYQRLADWNSTEIDL
jgi:serine/threonine-protein kinase RsbW